MLSVLTETPIDCDSAEAVSSTLAVASPDALPKDAEIEAEAIDSMLLPWTEDSLVLDMVAVRVRKEAKTL